MGQRKFLSKFLIVSLVFLMVSTVISMTIPTTNAAGSITLSSSQADAGSSVTIAGTGYPANTSVGIGFGQSIQITGETINVISSGTGGTTRDATFNHRPVKPGTYHLLIVRPSDGYSETQDDDGAGTIYRTSDQRLYGTINYALGTFHREGVTTNPADYVVTATYYCYQYDLTPIEGITSSASGSFTANIAVPNVGNNTYTVTAIGANGDVAVSSLSVSTQPIPEGFSIGVVMLLSIVAVIFGALHLGKVPKIRKTTIR